MRSLLTALLPYSLSSTLITDLKEQRGPEGRKYPVLALPKSRAPSCLVRKAFRSWRVVNAGNHIETKEGSAETKAGHSLVNGGWVATGRDRLAWAYLYAESDGMEDPRVLTKHMKLDAERALRQRGLDLLGKKGSLKKLEKFGVNHDKVSREFLSQRPLSSKALTAIVACGDHPLWYRSGKMHVRIGEPTTGCVTLLSSEGEVSLGYQIGSALPESWARSIEVSSFSKPLKAVSAYTLQELEAMCRLLDLDVVCSRRTKTVLHNALKEALQ